MVTRGDFLPACICSDTIDTERGESDLRGSFCFGALIRCGSALLSTCMWEATQGRKLMRMKRGRNFVDLVQGINLGFRQENSSCLCSKNATFFILAPVILCALGRIRDCWSWRKAKKCHFRKRTSRDTGDQETSSAGPGLGH